MNKVSPPHRLPLPINIALANYLMELIFAVLASDPFSNFIKRRLLLMRGSQVGDRPKFGRNLWIDDYSKLLIGNHVFFNYGCQLQATGGIQIDDNVLLGPGVTILSANHDIARGTCMRTGPAIFKPVHIESDVWLGGRCVISPGVTVGQGAVVAAGAVVTKNVPPYTVVGGAPASFIKERHHQTFVKTNKD